MKEHPILLSGPMVCAIIEGRKTQTRRILKLDRDGLLSRGGNYIEMNPHHGPLWTPYAGSGLRACPSDVVQKFCPYGRVGDRLWVRETLARPDGDPWLYAADKQPVMVSAEDETAMLVWAHHKEQDHCVSIHMPRWASRLTLEIADVRVQRLQEISAADARAEGMESCTPYDQFRALWDSINGKRASWQSNPWIWALSFKVVHA